MYLSSVVVFAFVETTSNDDEIAAGFGVEQYSFADVVEKERRGEDAFREKLGLLALCCNWLIGFYFLRPERPIRSWQCGVLGVVSALVGLHGVATQE